MKSVSLTIDNRQIRARSCVTILQAASAAGIEIPTLCSLPGLDALGGCRICLVEVAGRPRPLPACATRVEAGMVVTSDSPPLLAIRRQIVELLLAERNHQCPVCVMNNNCELQTLARRFGIDHVRYTFVAPNLTVDISHARFGIDHNRCILCRRCVRVCDQVEGAHTWDVAKRGTDSRIISDLARPWGQSASCTDCGKCVQACPTGALFDKNPEGTEKGGICLERLLQWRHRRDR